MLLKWSIVVYQNTYELIPRLLSLAIVSLASVSVYIIYVQSRFLIVLYDPNCGWNSILRNCSQCMLITELVVKHITAWRTHSLHEDFLWWIREVKEVLWHGVAMLLTVPFLPDHIKFNSWSCTCGACIQGFLLSRCLPTMFVCDSLKAGSSVFTFASCYVLACHGCVLTTTFCCIYVFW